VLINFEDDADVVSPKIIPNHVTVTATISVVPVFETAKSHLIKEEWAWSDLRDYVVGQIEQLHGPFPRNPIKEAAIFKSFISRWPRAQEIAKCAFEVHKGYWSGAPISVNRFCLSSDSYFGRPIMDSLEA